LCKEQQHSQKQEFFGEQLEILFSCAMAIYFIWRSVDIKHSGTAPENFSDFSAL
jgi:hypothetical protein